MRNYESYKIGHELLEEMKQKGFDPKKNKQRGEEIEKTRRISPVNNPRESFLEQVEERRKKSEIQLPSSLSLEDLCKKEFPPQKWVVENMFAIGTINQITGAPNNWKTWTTQHIALAVAKGQKAFDHFETTQMGVLLINEEDNESFIQGRAKLLDKEYAVPLRFYIEIGIKLEDYRVEQLIKEMKDKNLKLIIFDSLSTIHSEDEKDAGGMSKVFDQMQKFIREGFTVIFTHHHRKKPANGNRDDPQEQTRGSTVINARVAGHIVCEERDEDDGKYILISQAKLKGAPKLKPFKVRINTDDGIKLVYGGEFEGALEAINRVKNEILDIAIQNGWLRVGDYIKIGTGKDRTIRDALRQLVKDELMETKTRKQLMDLGVRLENEGKHNEKFYRRVREEETSLSLDGAVLGNPL